MNPTGPGARAQLLQRIMRADYWFPSHRPASREVKELLGAILVVDPAKRLTIAEIQQHAWRARAPRSPGRLRARRVDQEPGRQQCGVMRVLPRRPARPGGREAAASLGGLEAMGHLRRGVLHCVCGKGLGLCGCVHVGRGPSAPADDRPLCPWQRWQSCGVIVSVLQCTCSTTQDGSKEYGACNHDARRLAGARAGSCATCHPG
jgi:hypothetical protein